MLPRLLLAAVSLSACARAASNGAADAGAEATPADAGIAAPAPVLVADSPVRTLVDDGRDTCALHDDGSRTCWGGRTGPTPRRSFANQLTPKPSRWPECVVRPDHTVACPSSSQPIAGLEDIEEIAGHVVDSRCVEQCARTMGGTVLCWGGNDKGQLGRGTITARAQWHGKSNEHCIQPQKPPALVKGVRDAAQIAGGYSYFCARSNAGRVTCWGNVPARLPSGTPQLIEGLDDVVQIVAGPRHVCALARDGQVRCFGENIIGQLANGWTSTGDPREVPGIHDAVAVHAGNYFSCARTRASAVACWGQLDPDAPPRGAPEALPLPGPAAQITGEDVPCALLENGELHCLKRGRFIRVPAPQLQRVDVGSLAACGVAGGRVLCSENTPSGAPPRWTAPVGFDVTDAVDVALGAFFTSVLRADGTVEWFGQDPMDYTQTRRARLTGLDDVKAIAASGHYGCALQHVGAVWCWGYLTGAIISRTPTRIPGITAIAIAAEPSLACEVTTQGKLACWGDEVHQRATGDPSALTNVTDVSLSTNHACAVLEDGHVTCWGDADHGATGTGTIAERGVSETPLVVDIAHAVIER